MNRKIAMIPPLVAVELIKNGIKEYSPENRELFVEGLSEALKEFKIKEIS